jgi:cysteine synthase A
MRKGMKGLEAKIIKSPCWSPQFENPANIEIQKNCIRNYKSISRRFRLYDYWGWRSYYGCAAILKQHYPNLKVFAVEPEASQLLVEVILLHPIQELALDLYLNPQIYLMEPYK